MRFAPVLRPVSLLLPLVVVMGACGSDEGNGPPRAPCPAEPTIHAPICGSSCTAACGCKGCTDGELRTIDEVTYVCKSNCYESSGVVDGGGGSAGSAGSANQDSGPDCDAIACDPPAICDQCQNVCGCCNPCEEGQQTTIGGGIYQCTGGCFQQIA